MGFLNFIIYNFITYIVYKIIDYIFTFLGLFSNPKLGESLSIMPTQSDFVLIVINIVFSMVIAFVIYKRVKL